LIYTDLANGHKFNPMTAFSSQSRVMATTSSSVIRVFSRVTFREQEISGRQAIEPQNQQIGMPTELRRQMHIVPKDYMVHGDDRKS
jgi:hypothetical protein